MAKNLPATQDGRSVSYKTISGEQITLSFEIVREFMVTGKKELVTEQELFFFMGIAKAKGMNPLARDCYLVKFDQNPAAIIVAIDFCRARARAQADCRGWQKGVICLQKDGTLRYSAGLVLTDETLVGGWFEAQPTGWDVPFKLEVNLSGYAKNNAFWTKEKAPTMIAKCAESQGLRALWPQALQGTLAAEEIGELSEALTAGELLPQAGAGTGPGAAPEPPDTSAFDALVEAKIKELTASEATARATHLGQFLKETAERMSTKKASVTAEALMVNAAPFFEPYVDKNKNQQVGFWKKFLAWEESPDRPWNQEAPPVVEPGAEGGPTEKAESAAAAGDNAGEPGEETFEARRDRLWTLVTQKSPPLKAMKDACGVTNLKTITPDNVDAFEKFITEFEKK